MPIQAGENWWGPHELMEAVRVKATDLLMPDVMKIGGVTGWMRSAAIAEVEGLRICNHLFPEISVQLICVTPTAYLQEFSGWWNDIIKDPLPPQGGKINMYSTRGSGVDWNEEGISRLIMW